MENNQSNVKEAINAGKKLAAGKIIAIEGIPFILTAEGVHAEQHEHLLPQPQRTKRRVQTDTPEAFCDYFNYFATDQSVIFCNREKGEFTGIIDFDTKDKPSWADHQVTFTAKQTNEASAWLTRSGMAMNQNDFAMFIEQNAEEITAPPAAEMLEIALNLKAKTNITFTSAKRLDNGQTQLQYAEEIQGSAGRSGQLTIPEIIKLGMRIYEGGDAYEMEARFRYRIKEGAIAMWFDLIRPHKVKQAAIDDIYTDIAEKTNSNLLIHGTP